MKKEEIIASNLIQRLIDEKITMVMPFEFEMVLRHFDKIKKIKGDIIECGVWRGGFSIFLAHLFENRSIWVSDSYEGFQPLEHAKYSYDKERHTPTYTSAGILGPIGISLGEVQSHFEAYRLGNEKRIKYLKGFVKDTLPHCGIEDIALLRIDVDSYSAHLEVLDELYDKVQPGGYIIFDDSCLYESMDAIKYFFGLKNLGNEIIDPIDDQPKNIYKPYTNTDSGFTAGCYIIKQ
jgi:hypothetical protein